VLAIRIGPANRQKSTRKETKDMPLKRSLWAILIAALLATSTLGAQEPVKILFPYSPIGLNSLPWMLAKDGGIFERNGLNVDIVFMGFSPLVISTLLSGTADFAGLGGPAIISNVLQGGDIVFVAATVPYFGNS